MSRRGQGKKSKIVMAVTAIRFRLRKATHMKVTRRTFNLQTAPAQHPVLPRPNAGGGFFFLSAATRPQPSSSRSASANDLLIQACPQAIEWPGRAATAYGLLQPKVVPFLDHIHAGSGGQIVYPVVYPGAFFDPTGARNFQKPLQLGMSALGQ
jgi:hypothetical protein